MMDNYQFAIEELSLSGEISLGKCSKRTVYRWAKEITARLTQENYPWRVKVDAKARIIQAVLA